ncbi:sigma-E factor negative regulatory protein [Paraburkholderia sp. Ac-20340]|uniref:sigma-E factor negative regulatory protein n=1 Tax=Paraburkholderia sp. Ac-20340 TaxID=2703888 RepID=UPI00197E2B20|nr:sigma-E factor negative regulatory protein [Paraburkholderia sp. Ac-20340]MBN3855482.1 sigma-E factor negative regulatory protein [Paraburkholderia sp. Ac-20340]
MGSVSMQSVSSSHGERLSAFVDGEFAAEVDTQAHLNAIFSGFVEEDRKAWSAYHLIGDALRSDDLAMSPAASQSFMANFAARFEAEPHVLAPAAVAADAPAATHNGRVARILSLRRRVVPSLAVAAAAATLTWVVVPQMRGVGMAGGSQIAAMQPAGDNVQRVAMNAVPVQTAAVQDGGNIIRDARLDAYLEAHQQFAQQPVMSDSMPLIRSAALTTQGQ